jgi:hypothetical protein
VGQKNWGPFLRSSFCMLVPDTFLPRKCDCDKSEEHRLGPLSPRAGGRHVPRRFSERWCRNDRLVEVCMCDFLRFGTEELRRLTDGLGVDEQFDRQPTVEFVIRCSGNAEDVIGRARSLLTTVVQASLRNWPTSDQWREILPSWFIDSCATEPSIEEAQAQLDWWRSLSREEQISADREVRWTLNSWLYWLQPTNRHWYWWGDQVLDEDSASVSVIVDGWPFPWGSLSWLLRGSGATEVLPLSG